MNPTYIHKYWLTAVLIAVVGVLTAAAQNPVFNIIKPSTTGVPCDEVRVMTFDASGNLWIAGRQIYWWEAAVAMLSADQLAHQPLPGGGFETGDWRVWSSVHHPIPSVFIRGLVFSSDGTIWLASDGGLTRFRPNAQPPEEMWFTYTTANSPLVMNEIRSIAIDSQDNLWISNARVSFAFSQLFKLNTATGQWTSINTGQQPWEVAVGNNDHVFISMITVGGISEFDGNSWVVHPANPREMELMMQDAQGNLWAVPGVNGNGLWKWNGSSWQNWPQIGGTITVTGIGKDRDGVVYVSSWYGGIYKMINDTPVFFAAADNIPRSVIGRPNGEIWINNFGGNGTVGTVRQYTADGQLLRRMNTYNSGLPDYFIDRIMRDSQGNMWFTSMEGGISRMLGSNGAPDAACHWRNFGSHNDASEPYPWGQNEGMSSVYEDSDGVFWMGGNGVGRWNSNTGQFTGFWNSSNSNLDTSLIKAIAKRQGTTWVGSGGSGVCWLTGNDWTRVWLDPINYNYDINYVNAMAVDTANNLWVGSNFGLRKFAPGNNTSFTEYYTSNSPLPSDYILELKADPSGGLWIGTAEGLVRFNGNTWTVYNQANTGMPGRNVNGIARRPSDGMIAIANNQPSTWPYTGGVSTFDGTTWRHYTPNNSPLIHWQIMAVEFDGDGNLWATDGSEGVVQIMIGVPAATINISGALSYCSNPSAPALPGVTLNLTGDATLSIQSDTSGQYQFSSLLSGRNYVVTPTKAALTPASGGGNINTIDLIAMQRHFLRIGTLLSGCPLIAADVNGDSAVNTLDVIAVQRFFLGAPTGIANTGTYKFSPASRSYRAATGNQSNQNYEAVVFGDVTAAFVHEPGSPATVGGGANGASPNETLAGVKVTLPEVTIDRSASRLILPVKVSSVDAENNIVGFQGDLTFDERVISFDQEPVEKAGLTSGNWNVSANVLPGVGPFRTLRISAFSTDFAPLSGSGELFALRMRTANGDVSTTQLTWAAPPGGFVFINADLAIQEPSYAGSGLVKKSFSRSKVEIHNN